MPQSTPRGTAPDRPALRLIHGSAPAGCLAETTSTVQTPFGAVTVRVRRFRAARLLSPAGDYAPGTALEVAVRTPRTSRDGRGFVCVQTIPDAVDVQDLAVHVALGAAIERAAETRAAAVATETGTTVDQVAGVARFLVDDDPGTERPDGVPPIWPAAPAALRRVRPAQTTREAKRRLLNARCRALVEHAMPCDAEGVLLTADDVRHQAAEAASGGRTTSSLRLSDDELDEALTGVEDQLYRAGFDFDQADAEYRSREAQRAALPVQGWTATQPGRKVAA